MILMSYLLSTFGNIQVIEDMHLTLIAPFIVVIGLFIVILIDERRNYISLAERFHERKVEVSEEDILYGYPENQVSVRWSEFKKGVFLKRLIILYTQNNQQLLIPEHFFSSVEEKNEWIGFIKSHLPN